MLRESLSQDIVFKNPLQTRHGLAEVTAHLEGFQVRSPGGSFRMNNMVGWGTYALAEWQLVDAKGDAGFSGYDVLTFDEQGLISTILLFGNVEAQKLRVATSRSGVAGADPVGPSSRRTQIPGPVSPN